MLIANGRPNSSNFPKQDFKGKKVTSEDLVLIAKTTEEELKLTVSISKKVASRAVDRNRIKRIIKESTRSDKVFKGEVLVIVKKNLAHLKMPEIRVKLENLFKKL